MSRAPNRRTRSDDLGYSQTCAQADAGTCQEARVLALQATASARPAAVPSESPGSCQITGQIDPDPDHLAARSLLTAWRTRRPFLLLATAALYLCAC